MSNRTPSGEASSGAGEPGRDRPHARLRPRDAATLMLIDRSGTEPRILMGRRHSRHVFMPGRLVFPGGRTDPADARVRIADTLHPLEERKLSEAARGAARARAIALSALRETYEEAGIMIGCRGAFTTRSPQWKAFQEHGVQPALGGLRYLARAVTPPGRPRRFDTRFLTAWREDVAIELPGGGPTDELEELAWFTFAEARAGNIISITRAVLDHLASRLAADPELTPGGPVPYFRAVHGRHTRTVQ